MTTVDLIALLVLGLVAMAAAGAALAGVFVGWWLNTRLVVIPLAEHLIVLEEERHGEQEERARHGDGVGH